MPDIRQVRAALAIAGAIGVLAYSGVTRAEPQSDLVRRGDYLTRAADCMPCHTEAGGKPFAGGRAFKLPFGTLYSSNITRDGETGIGQWSDDDFVRAMHQGIRRDGARLYPAFPYPSYTLLSREDVLAIKAYIFSLPPVRNTPPQNTLGFPYNQRWLMVFWDWLYNPDRRFQADAAKPPQWNRGAYLVEALGHCGDCHTPRNFLYGPKSGRKLAGALTVGWRAYNITPDQKSGIGGWSNDELERYLASGVAQHGVAAGPMGEAVQNSLQYLSKDDIAAMIAYLRSVPAVSSAIPAPARPPVASDGAANALPPPDDLKRLYPNAGLRVYAAACTGCHGWDGRGIAATRDVNDPQATNLAHVVLEGVHLRTGASAVDMPDFGKGYGDAEVAALANYVTGRFGAKAAALTAEDVAKQRSGE